MNYRVLISEPAKRQIQDLDPPIQKRVYQAILRLSQEPSLGKPLTGPLKGIYSYRVGDWRLAYEIQRKILTVLVVGVGHRREIYDLLQDVFSPLH